VRLLIDMHILLWADERPRRIAPTLRAAVRDETNEVVVSAGDNMGNRDQAGDREALL
jgi:PIN domain nuclease of toxin-antitoxin system